MLLSSYEVVRIKKRVVFPIDMATKISFVDVAALAIWNGARKCLSLLGTFWTRDFFKEIAPTLVLLTHMIFQVSSSSRCS